MPGHKLSRGIPHGLSRDVLQLDVTEVEGTDNLHYPEGIIKEAQELAAKAFGADRTFFLVNGSTCGIIAAIMSVCARGQKLIIGRDSHKSVVSGLILSGAEPVYVYPDYNSSFGIPESISSHEIENALRENPDAAAVLITRPNYYGICGDIESIAETVHSHGKILIVDEAHGAHLAFSPLLPPSSLEFGADICIQSAHKTLPAVTQGAYMHIKGTRADIDRIKFNLAMLQTSSPSYIIMTYLDIARELMETEGGKKFETLLDNIEAFKNNIANINVYRVLSNKILGTNILQDPTRLVVNTKGLGITGYEAERILREQFSTQVEMADYENLVLITTVADTSQSFERLSESLTRLSQIKPDMDWKRKSVKLMEIVLGHKSTGNVLKMAPYKAYSAEKQWMPLEKSGGRICANTVTPYPPGIPALYPGEMIDDSIAEYIKNIIEAGGKVNGIDNNNSVQVIK